MHFYERVWHEPTKRPTPYIPPVVATNELQAQELTATQIDPERRTQSIR